MEHVGKAVNKNDEAKLINVNVPLTRGEIKELEAYLSPWGGKKSTFIRRLVMDTVRRELDRGGAVAEAGV